MIVKRSPFLISVALLFLAAGCTKLSRQEASRGMSNPPRASAVVVSAGDTNAAEPAIAVAADKSVYVAWVEHRGKDADVFVRRFNADGRRASEAVRVNPEVGAATAWRGDPPVLAIADDGTVYVSWSARAGSAHATNIYLSVSRDRGTSFNTPTKVNDDKAPADHGLHSLAVTNGRIYVAWLDERNVAMPEGSAMADGHHMESNRELFVSSSTDGGQSFSANQRVATNVCPCCKTNITVAKDGRLYLSWRQVLPNDYRHIAVSSSVDGGKTFSKPVIVSDDQWMLRGCPVSGASLSAEADGRLLVLWYAAGEKGQHGLYWSGTNDGGQTFSTRQLVAATTAMGTPVLVHNRDGYGSGVWQDNENGESRVVAIPLAAANGNTDKIVIATAGEVPAAAETADQLFVAYAAREGERQRIMLQTLAK